MGSLLFFLKRIRPMNLKRIGARTSVRFRAALADGCRSGLKSALRNAGSWEASTISESRIGAVNRSGERGRPACCARRRAEHVSMRGHLPVRETRTGATGTVALPRPSADSWEGKTSKVWTRIGAMNRERRVWGPGLHFVGPVPSPGGSWRAFLSNSIEVQKL